MKDPKKIVIVLLVVVTLLFVAAMTTGAFSGQGSPDPEAPDNDFVSAIGDRAGAAATVDPATVDAPCRDDDVANLLIFTGGCGVRVPPGGDGLRLLRLQAETAVEVTAPAPDDDADFEVTATLEAGEQTEVAVGENGAGIAFGCPALAQCAVVLLAGE